MDVLQKEIDEVYATHPTAHEALDNGIVEQHQQFVRSLTEVNGGCAVISDLSNRKSYVTVHPWANFLGLTPEEAALSVIDSMDEDCIYRRIHPEDLVEKRLMEYKFFQNILSVAVDCIHTDIKSRGNFFTRQPFPYAAQYFLFAF